MRAQPDLTAAADRIELVCHRARILRPAAVSQLFLYGEGWYNQQAMAIRAIGEAVGVSGNTALAVAAALAPRKQWEHAMRAIGPTVPWARGAGPRPVGFYSRSLEAAKRAVLFPAVPPFDPRTAPKSADFLEALKGDRSKAVVDVWAARVAGLRVNTLAQYRDAAQAYREAAARLGAQPRDVQELAWVAVRDWGVAIPAAVVPVKAVPARGRCSVCGGRTRPLTSAGIEDYCYTCDREEIGGGDV